MPKRQKCPTCSKGWCKNHLFEFIPMKKDLYFKKIQKIRVCPKLNKSSNSYQKIIPQFNRDQKFYTPSFIIEEEERFYEENDHRMKQNHLEKINSNKSGESEMYIPKHGRKKNYCSVCHNQYEDYLEHVRGDHHKNKLKNNSFNKSILEFEETFKKSQSLAQTQIEKKPENNQIDETEDVLVREGSKKEENCEEKIQIEQIDNEKKQRFPI